MGKKIRSNVYGDDWVKAKGEEGNSYVELDVSLGETRDHLFLTPSDARKLRKQIKKALEAIEGVEEESGEGARLEPNGVKHKVGDQVRIIGNKYPTNNRSNVLAGPHGHGFRLGDVVIIQEVDQNDPKRPYFAGGKYGWLAAEDIEPA